MKLIFINILLFSSTVFSQSALELLEGSSDKTAEITITREKAVLYSGLKTRINVNSNLVAKLGNGKTTKFYASEGTNTFSVSGFGFPGQSSVTFRVKAGETYTLYVASRKSSFWAMMGGGALGVGALWSTALESSLNETEGGGFRISLIDTSERRTEEANDVIKNDEGIETQLKELKDLFEKGLITEELYMEEQKRILQEK